MEMIDKAFVTGAEDTVSENVKEQEKKYTDADVDRIVAHRLQKWRKATGKGKTEADKASELDIREKSLLERELRLDARDALTQKGIPATFCDFLNYESQEACQESTEKLVGAINALITTKLSEQAKKLLASDPKAGKGVKPDLIRDAFMKR